MNFDFRDELSSTAGPGMKLELTPMNKSNRQRKPATAASLFGTSNSNLGVNVSFAEEGSLRDAK